MKELIDDLHSKEVKTPLLLRFPDILGQRIESLSQCFQKAKEEYNFTGKYYTVYPIKVNQQRPVVEEVVSKGRKCNIGLEAGSKPELHAVLAVMENPDALIICNGYKDTEYIELAILAQKMGKKIFLVIEKLSELKLIQQIAQEHNVTPTIGIRIKLASLGAGKWEESGGDHSKFGLSSSELMEAIDFLKINNLTHYLKLIHFHLGSQITNIRNLKAGFREVAQFYVQLHELGITAELVDIGGGLGVDYDGSASNSHHSINYSIQEYANDAVFALQEACEQKGAPHPNLISESGRSITAHHSILIFNVLETSSVPSFDLNPIVETEKAHKLVIELHEIFNDLSTGDNTFEPWYDALQIRQDAHNLFSLGLLDLPSRAKIESLFWSIAALVHKKNQKSATPDVEIAEFSKKLAVKYFCNFSLFQSLPDSWAIQQHFPIMPIHRLDEAPQHDATLQDITCDSDGKISHFIGEQKNNSTLKLHTFSPESPYYIGVFLVGAYQEILGDLHNLFGDTHVVHVGTKEGSCKIEQIIEGETVSDVLSYVQFNSKKLVKTMEAWVSASINAKKITPKEGKLFLADYRSGLYGYTYLESDAIDRH